MDISSSRHLSASVRRRVLAAVGTLAAAAAVVVPTVPAAAAAPVAATVSVVATGNNVTATASITASPSTAVTQLSVCMRKSDGSNYDFAYRYNLTLTSTPLAYSAARTVPAGTYAYYVCALVNGSWNTVTAHAKITVTDSPAVVEAQQAATASTVTAAPRGDLPGWKQVFVDDFTTDVACGSWATSSYSPRYLTYSGFRDTSGKGVYSKDIISVRYGALFYNIKTSSYGNPLVAAVVPRVPATNWGQTYGRYSVRFKTDLLPGYKLSFNLWPDSDNWGEGELDLPEVDNLQAGKKIYASFHGRGNLSTGTALTSRVSMSSVDGANSGWHVATVEWSPGLVVFYLDGLEIGRETSDVPSTRLHWVLQAETAISGGVPAASTAGAVKIDWVTMYSRAS